MARYTQDDINNLILERNAQKKADAATRKRDYTVFIVRRDGSRTPDTQPGRGTLKDALSWATAHAHTITDASIVAIEIVPDHDPAPPHGGLGTTRIPTKWDTPLIVTIGDVDMTKQVNIDDIIAGMTSTEIDDMIRRGQAAKEAKRKAEIAEAKTAVEELLAARGLRFWDVFGSQVAAPATTRSRSSGKKSGEWKAKLGVKYAHPDDSNITWIGARGKREAWVTDLLDAGREPVMVEE